MLVNQAIYENQSEHGLRTNMRPFLEGMNFPGAGSPNTQYPINDPSILHISGNSYTIQMKSREAAQNAMSTQQQQIKSLRVKISGTMVQTFNLCCWISTLILGSLLLFPLFFACCDWWKRKALPMAMVDKAAYSGLASLIHSTGAEELYLTVNDNYFDIDKAQILIDAVARSKIKNFSMVNIAPGFNTSNKNYSDFNKYMLPLYQYVKYGQIRWATKIVL